MKMKKSNNLEEEQFNLLTHFNKDLETLVQIYGE